VQVGDELGLAPERLHALAVGGLLHDIGKLSVPDVILRKPGPLTDDEFEAVKRHVETGAALLEELGGYSAEVHRLVRSHHERLDGTGYPSGAQGTELTLDVRILAVCDVYDALLSTRVYRSAWTHERAIAYLRERAATQFEPRCVDALERVLARERGDALDIAV
jgi:HD-GYP domain-containing protein (c-di-GMP phosphodiesterase class II)